MRTLNWLVLGLGLWAVALTVPVRACIWDSDTLEMEKKRFPTTLQTIAGNFPQHSLEFHVWREAARRKRIAAEPELNGLYDDLAVSLVRQGKFDEAIEIMRQRLQIQPNRYETLSNLGTFYMMQGKWGEGLPYIERALAVNPNAHFGREKYQRLIAKYVIARLKDGKTVLPLAGQATPSKAGPFGFGAFAFTQLDTFAAISSRDWEATAKAMREGSKEAVIAIQGMLTFADHRSPILLESLGDALYSSDGEFNASELAAIAYLAASESAPNRKAEYEELANAAVGQLEGAHLRTKEAKGALEKERAAGVALNEKVRADEIAWIAQGDQADMLFTQKYLAKP